MNTIELFGCGINHSGDISYKIVNSTGLDFDATLFLFFISLLLLGLVVIYLINLGE
jgi:hypothetical protein